MCAEVERFSILIVESNSDRRAYLSRALPMPTNKVKIYYVEHLTAAYHVAEHKQPDIVVLAEKHQYSPGFPMFISMLSSYSIDWYLLEHQKVHRVPHDRKINLSILNNPCAFGTFLSDWHRRKYTLGSRTSPHCKRQYPVDQPWKTVVMGASTGGIEALLTILAQYPVHCPPTLIVQHMRPGFVPGLAERLNRYCPAQVRPAHSYDHIKSGLVLLAPGGDQHMTLTPTGQHCQLREEPSVEGHRPSIDVLFRSASVLGAGVVGVLLTGMGRDGAVGLSAIRNTGGHTIVQNRATSTVYGMPRAAVEMGAAQQQLPIQEITTALLSAAAEVTNETYHA